MVDRGVRVQSRKWNSDTRATNMKRIQRHKRTIKTQNTCPNLRLNAVTERKKYPFRMRTQKLMFTYHKLGQPTLAYEEVPQTRSYIK